MTRPSNRREFIRETAASLGAAFALPLVLPEVLSPGTRGSERLTRIGLQLYTVRDQMQKSVEKTLARVAAIGYSEVEFDEHFGKSPAQIAAMLKATGLKAPSAHIHLDDIRKQWPRILDAAAIMGHDVLVCPDINENERTIDGYNRVADEFNRAAEQAKAHKIGFAYHNHAFEFNAIGGVLPYDLLLSKCDAHLVMMEMDLYWINKAGHDPLPYWAKYPGRFTMVHVKDMTPTGAMADVGAGKIPFAKYFAKAKQAGIVHYYVEHDDPTDSFVSIENSFKFLKALEF